MKFDYITTALILLCSAAQLALVVSIDTAVKKAGGFHGIAVSVGKEIKQIKKEIGE